MPGAERNVAVSGGLLSRRDFIDPLDKCFENGEYGVGDGGLVTGVGYFLAANGFREGDHEAEEVFAGIGVVEAANVVGGLDFFGGGLEIEGGRDWGDRLGLRNRGEDYGLLGVVVWREIDRWGSNGSVVWGWRVIWPGRRRCGHGGCCAAFAASRCRYGGGGWC